MRPLGFSLCPLCETNDNNGYIDAHLLGDKRLRGQGIFYSIHFTLTHSRKNQLTCEVIGLDRWCNVPLIGLLTETLSSCCTDEEYPSMDEWWELTPQDVRWFDCWGWVLSRFSMPWSSLRSMASASRLWCHSGKRKRILQALHLGPGITVGIKCMMVVVCGQWLLSSSGVHAALLDFSPEMRVWIFCCQMKKYAEIIGRI